jgi:hypothetical protein
MNLNFIIYGAIIAAIIVLVWIIYAYNYRTSVSRLCRLAAGKYISVVPNDIKEKYVILCDEKLSKYDSANSKFIAIFTFTPDHRYPGAPQRGNTTVIFDVITKSDPCELSLTACGEVNQDNCSKPDAKQIIVRAANCININ